MLEQYVHLPSGRWERTTFILSGDCGWEAWFRACADIPTIAGCKCGWYYNA